jgi:hypothetical protein
MKWNPLSIVGGCVVLFVLTILAASCTAILAESDNSSGIKDSTTDTQDTSSPPKSKKESPKKLGISFEDGMYLVGTDIKAGSYKTDGDADLDLGCYWERTKDDSGEFGSIIANEYADGPGRVTVNSGEYFKVSGGCTWVRQ